VLTYGYDASTATFFDDDAAENVQRLAESLVQGLRANRQFAGTLRRPIIFICHGLGGVLVKKSLVYSSTRTSVKVDHLWDQYISTFAVVFFGTPHGKTPRGPWLALEKQARRSRPSPFRIADPRRPSAETHLSVPLSVNNEFAPLVKQFHMFLLWETVPTSIGDHDALIVDHALAAPKIDNTETAGINATHQGMVKFSSATSSDYCTVVAALANYCEKAPAIIAQRWKQADAALKQLRVGEAWELGGYGFDVHSEEPFRHQDIPLNRDFAGHRHFYPPQDTTSSFIGRQDILDSLDATFFPHGLAVNSPSKKSFVVFGMGGSGKTQLCAKFAQDYKHR
jgi:hypothetical protein